MRYTSRMQEADQAAHDAAERELLLAVYEAVTARRNTYDSLFWEVPALSLTAQAFLMTIALGPDTARGARVIAAAVGFLMALISVQLFTKHRALERLNSQMAELCERKLGIDRVLGFAPHGSPGEQARAWRPMRWPASMRSYTVWLIGLSLFGVASASILVLSLLRPSFFER